MREANSDLESTVTITENELTVFIISLIHTLKRSKKKCGRLEVDNLLQESTEFKISSAVFTEILKSLTGKQDKSFTTR